MSLKNLLGVFDPLKIKSVGLPVSVTGTTQNKRYRHASTPKKRFPYWYMRQEREDYDEKLSPLNAKFIEQVVKDKYIFSKNSLSPLKEEPYPKHEWSPEYQRTGVIGIKLGILPQWLKNGNKIVTTLIQILDNHVIRYLPPGTQDLRPYAKKYAEFTKGMGNLVVGALDGNPQNYTKEYCQLFSECGIIPKKVLTKFPIHPNSAIQPGTPLYAAHFSVGDSVDVTGQTIYRGFQGVMKRWGFHGMPASHGQTKTHRRGGNIGAGGDKDRVWPGQKMPGHMGLKHRTMNGLKVLRINHKHNVLYVSGTIPGDVNSIVFVHDTKVAEKKRTTAPPFPTYFPDDGKELPEEEFDESLFQFTEPTIMFEEEKKVQKKRK